MTGINAIDAKIVSTMPVTIEFVLNPNIKVFPLQKKAIEFLKHMKEVELNLLIMDPSGTYKWKSPEDIPARVEFEMLMIAKVVTNP